MSLNITGRATTPFIIQDESSECGLACIAMIAGYYGYRTGLHDLRRRFGTTLRGTALPRILEISEKLGLSPRPVRCELADLRQLTLPAILHWNLTHFVVLKRVRRSIFGDRYHINDPARGELILDAATISASFTGIAIEITKGHDFKKKVEQSRLALSGLWTSASGLSGLLLNVFALSLVLQFVAIAAPFYSQIAVDTVLPSADGDLLVVLAGGFFLISVIGFVTMWIRGLVIATANQSLAYQMISNLFRHLMQLPLSWFEKRHVGDIVSRFGSTTPIGQMFSQGFVTGIIDGLLAITTLSMVILYSGKLAILAILTVLLYALLRWTFLHALKMRNIDAISTSAKENSVFIESVRGISAIKAFGEETNRFLIWQRAKADSINAQVKLGRLSSGFDAASSFLPSVERVIFIYIAMRLVISGDMSLGMVFAVQSYKQQFIDAGIRITEQAVSLKVLQVHLGRISDIALSKIEPRNDAELEIPALSEGITLQDVRYRYGSADPEILSGVNLHIRLGEIVALVGPSGGGKTTLLKILMGLIDPTHGNVYLDHHRMNKISRQAWRKTIGFVAQDDVLFAGTISENISFFSSESDTDQIAFAARAAEIEHDILGMPMGYDTRVGDMGSSLSGGQKQRILLARALYRRPQILFMDEGTANLDIPLEIKVLESLKGLGISIIMVAHRAQSIAAADSIYHVGGGCVLKAQKGPPPQDTAQQQNDTLN